MQQNCIEELQEGQLWVPGRLTNEGHAVFAVGYDKNELTVPTRSTTQRATQGWWDECVDEA